MMATVAARYTILSCRTVQGWIDFSPSDVTSEASMRVKQMPTVPTLFISTSRLFFLRNLPVDIPLSKSYNLDDQSQILSFFHNSKELIIFAFKFKKWKN